MRRRDVDKIWFFEKMKFLLDVTSNQWWAFVLGIGAAVVYWFQLLLLTQKTISIELDQLIGLVFAVIIAIVGWLRFVYTTSGSLKS